MTVSQLPVPEDLAVSLFNGSARDRLWERWVTWKSAHSPSSVRAVEADAKIFGKFCAKTLYPMIPADPATVSKFLEAEARAGRAPATIERRVSSISVLHRLAEVQNPCEDELVKWRLRSIKKAHGKAQKQAGAIRAKGDVEDLALDKPEGLSVLTMLAANAAWIDHLKSQETTSLVTQQTKIAFRNAVLLSLGYDTGLRSSELVAVKTEHITENPDGAGELYVPYSKTDAEGEGSYRYISKRTMMLIAVWREAANIKGGFLFRQIVRSGIARGHAIVSETVARIYRTMATRYFELENGGFGKELTDEQKETVKSLSGHSTRVGVCQDAIAAGEDLLGVMQAFDWKSPRMPARYGARLSVRGGSASRLHRKVNDRGE